MFGAVREVLVMVDIDAAIRGAVEKQLVTSISNIPEVIDEAIRKSVLSLIGVEKFGSRYQLIDDISAIPKLITQRINNSIKSDTRLLDSIDKSIATVLSKKSFYDSLETFVQSRVSYLIESSLREIIDSFLKLVLHKYKHAMNEKAKNWVVDLNGVEQFNNPECFIGPLREMFLEEFAKSQTLPDGV